MTEKSKLNSQHVQESCLFSKASRSAQVAMQPPTQKYCKEGVRTFPHKVRHFQLKQDSDHWSFSAQVKYASSYTSSSPYALRQDYLLSTWNMEEVGSTETTVKFYQTIWHLTTASHLQMSNKAHMCVRARARVCVCVCVVSKSKFHVYFKLCGSSAIQWRILHILETGS